MRARLLPVAIFATPILAVVGGVGLLGGSAHADGISIVLDREVDAPPGSVTLLDSVAVDPALVRHTCTATYTGENNSSVHPGNDLIIASDSTQLVLFGVEDSQGRVTTASSALVLGGTIDVSVRLGSDGQASLGAAVSLVCSPPPTTSTPAPTTTEVAATSTTVEAATSTTSASSTSVAPTSTTTTVLASGGAVSSSSSTPTTAAATTMTRPTVVSAGGVTPTTSRAAVSSAGTALPSTGVDTAPLVMTALGLVSAGSALCLSRRRGARDGAR